MPSSSEREVEAERGTSGTIESGSRSSDGSRSRSRSSHRRHSRRRRRRRRSRKVSERNFAAAACSMIAIVCMCTALARAECFTFHGGDCHNSKGEYISKMGISTYFTGALVNSSTYHYNSFGDDLYTYNCVNSQIIAVMRAILSLCIISMILTVASFVMDLVGPKQRHVMLVRRNGILNILAVFLLVTVCGFCYWASVFLFAYLHAHPRAKSSKIYVHFGMSYYILVGSAVANILASALNLLRRYPPREPASEQSRPILTDAELISASEVNVPASVRVREPPPYAP